MELGRLLFYDKVLSGNKNIACGTCHHVSYNSTDKLSLAIGTGGIRNGPSRKLGAGRFIARNTADLYNKGVPSLTALFHDGRTELTPAGVQGPKGMPVPPGLSSVLAAQVLFPLAARDEMRGHLGDTTRFGETNEIAAADDDAFEAIWTRVVQRVLGYPEYLARFQAAFPGLDSAEIGIVHLAEAIAAFERASFTQLNTPFDRFLAGDASALSDSARRGARLFYGRARCAACHAGPLLTDNLFHNIGAPQLGDGIGAEAPLDAGRAVVTGRAEDRFAFRTPPLRNVALTGPWMHSGAYTALDAVVRHYRDPREAYAAYQGDGLDPRILPLVHVDARSRETVLATLDPRVTGPLPLSDTDVALLVNFLRALTDPAAFNQLALVPDAVPSGLPVRE